jgi:chromosome segregation ATPase
MVHETRSLACCFTAIIYQRAAVDTYTNSGCVGAALRKQAMQLKRNLSTAEQKATQLHRDIEFERYQKKGLQQLVDSFASTPADTPDEASDASASDGQANPGTAAAKQDAAALAKAQASLKKCESRIAELEERRAELETANVALTEQAAKLATAESEATEQASRAAEAVQTASAAESALSRYVCFEHAATWPGAAVANFTRSAASIKSMQTRS